MNLFDHGEFIVFEIQGLFSVQLWLASNNIYCDVADEVSDSRLTYWIVHQILPVFLFLSGTTEFLHGMAVSVTPDGDAANSSGCFAVLAPSYAGKSTLLSYFLSRGHAVVTDDHVALSRQNYTDVRPATPFYRPYRALEDVGLTALHFRPETLPLKRLYLLERALPDAEPKIQPVVGMEAIATIAWHLQYTLPVPEESNAFPFLLSRFEGLAQVARHVPIARLHVPRSLDRLPEVYDFIRKDLEN